MSPTDPSPTLLLVDGHAYAYRAFYAIRSLNSPDGAPTNAIYGFVKMLQKMEGILRPSHRLVLWDRGLAAERMAELPGYKQQRSPTPEDLERQFPEIERWLDAAGIAAWSQAETEADDWIGTYARRAEAQGWRTVVASSDKDFMQLVGPQVGLFNPNDKTEKVWTAAEVEAKTGVQPHQVVDWLSLIGDAVDNIPGVPGVGPKTATQLLLKYGSIESLLARVSEVKSESQRSNLQASVEQLQRNRRLISLKTDLSGGPALESLRVGTPDAPGRERLGAMYRRWGFRSLLSELGLPWEEASGQGTLL
jgi:DNA polymerase-1